MLKPLYNFRREQSDVSLILHDAVFSLMFSQKSWIYPEIKLYAGGCHVPIKWFGSTRFYEGASQKTELITNKCHTFYIFVQKISKAMSTFTFILPL